MTWLAGMLRRNDETRTTLEEINRMHASQRWFDVSHRQLKERAQRNAERVHEESIRLLNAQAAVIPFEVRRKER